MAAAAMTRVTSSRCIAARPPQRREPGHDKEIVTSFFVARSGRLASPDESAQARHVPGLRAGRGAARLRPGPRAGGHAAAGSETIKLLLLAKRSARPRAGPGGLVAGQPRLS